MIAPVKDAVVVPAGDAASARSAKAAIAIAMVRRMRTSLFGSAAKPDPARRGIIARPFRPRSATDPSPPPSARACPQALEIERLVKPGTYEIRERTDVPVAVIGVEAPRPAIGARDEERQVPRPAATRGSFTALEERRPDAP